MLWLGSSPLLFNVRCRARARAGPTVWMAASPGFGSSRALHATAPRRRDHHFDTLKFVKRLQSEGFTEEQSVAMMKVLSDVIEER